MIGAALVGSMLLPLCAQVAAPGPNPTQRGMKIERRLERRLSGIAPAARELLVAVRRAEPGLLLQGEQTTLLYRQGGPPEQSEQTIYRDGLAGYRCEYHAPRRLAGEIVVATPARSWRYVPRRRRLVVGIGRRVRLAPQITPALRALAQGRAQATLIGSDTVAGRSVEGVQITAASGVNAAGVGALKLWIDPATGAPLRTEVDDADGRVQSVTFFTRVSYVPAFPPGLFTAPATPPGTQVSVAKRAAMLLAPPSDADAGFHVLEPSYLPPGYRFVSASILSLGGRPAVALRYSGGLSLLSLFQSPLDPARPRALPMPARRLRAGTLLLTTPTTQLAAIGPLSDAELTRVLQSMR